MKLDKSSKTRWDIFLMVFTFLGIGMYIYRTEKLLSKIDSELVSKTELADSVTETIEDQLPLDDIDVIIQNGTSYGAKITDATVKDGEFISSIKIQLQDGSTYTLSGLESTPLYLSEAEQDALITAAYSEPDIPEYEIPDTEIADGSIVTIKLADDIITASKLADNSVATENIIDSTLLFSDLSQNGCLDEQVIWWGGIEWVCTDLPADPTFVSLTDTQATYTTGSLLVWDGTAVNEDTDLYWDFANGRLGIKNPTPSYELDVTGSINSDEICVGDDCVTSWSEVSDLACNPIYNQWDPDAPPVTASVYSDEFSDGTIDIMWTTSSCSTCVEENDMLRMRGWAYQTIPSGDFSIWTKMSIGGSPQYVNYQQNTLAVQAGTGTIYSVGMTGANTNRTNIEVMKWSDYLTYNSTPVIITLYEVHDLYLSIRRSGTTLSFWVSRDGLTYNRIYSVTDPGVTRMGPLSNSNSLNLYDFFRYDNAYHDQYWIPEGRLVGVGCE